MGADIVIIGGGPAGVATAVTARDVHPGKSLCLVEARNDGLNPQIVPYLLAKQDLWQEAQTSIGSLAQHGIETVAGRAVALIPKERRVMLDSGKELAYERLVLATGTEALKPNIPGINRDGIHLLPRHVVALTELQEELRQARNAVVIGGDAVGVALAEEIAVLKGGGPRVHLIESRPSLLHGLFDADFQAEMVNTLEKKGIAVHTGTSVAAFRGEQRVTDVALYGGRQIPADVVVLNLGAVPSTQMAAKARLRIAENGSIWVDEYMRTDTEGIFAVGDCALKRDFFTRKAVSLWLASTAAAEACNAATNLYGIRVLHHLQGTVAAFAARIGGATYASTGMTAAECEEERFRYIVTTAETPDRYPGYLPGARLLKVRLIVSDRSGIILGGQICGGGSISELINLVTLAIQQKVGVRELEILQVAAHPLLTPAPGLHPLINAAHQALARLRTGSGS